MTSAVAAASAHTYWAIALGIGARRRRGRRDPPHACCCGPSAASRSPSRACWRSRARSLATPRTFRKLEATAPVLSLIVDEAVVQDGYMNALTDGYGGA